MHYKKYLAIMLVVVLVITSFVSTSSARLKLLSNEKDNLIEDRGKIECYSLSNRVSDGREIYYIVGEKGISFMGRLYKKYVPVNMDDFPEFKQAGLEVEFTGKITIKHIISIHGIYCLRLQALPIELKEIRERNNDPDEAELDFDIRIKEENMARTPIPVMAVLTNEGENAVEVSEMGLEVMTLDFTITTPDELTLYFNNSRRIRRSPDAVTIEAGRSYIVEVEDITEPGLFVDDKLKDYLFIDGDYTICGHYFSGKYNPAGNIEEVLEIELQSTEYLFKISNQEPENLAPVSNPGGPYTGYVDEEITFDGSDSYDLDGNIVEWDWSYTNGDSFPTRVGDEKVVNFAFSHTGVFNLSLRVVDDKGAEDTAYTRVTTTEEPIPEKAMIYGKVRQDPMLPVPAFIPIGNATVLVSQKNSGESKIIYETNTNPEGYYELKVEAGDYSISVSKIGYETVTEEIKIDAGEEKQLDFVLKKKPIELKFEINIERDEYKADEPILVTAKLTNNGETDVKLSEMSLDHQSLDFIVITPDLKKIHYIGSVIKENPKIIKLAPGESHEVVTDITNAKLGDGDGVYDFAKTGRYTIMGIYNSKGKFTGEDAVWHGFLRSQLEVFVIEK